MSESPGKTSEGAPTPEQLAEELRKASVSDLLAQTCSLVASLGFAKLAAGSRDLEQARLAIEALKALEPLLPEEPARETRRVVASLQLAFAGAAAAPPEPPPEPHADHGP